MHLLARVLYSDDLNQVEQMLTRILVDPMAGSSFSNLPKQDETTRSLFTDKVIRQIESYEKAFHQILLLYNTQNIQNRRKTVGLKQIIEKNLGISARNFLRYCRICSLIPHTLNIESLQETIKAVCPPQDKEELSYYSNSILIKSYETDLNYFELFPLEPIPGEPTLTLYHLQLALGRIALENIKDSQDSNEKIMILFEEKLKLTQEFNYGPGCNVEYGVEAESDASFSSAEDHNEILQKYEHKQIVSQGNLRRDSDLSNVIKITPDIPTIEEIIKILDSDRVPDVPSEHIVVQKNPPPYLMPPTLFEIPKPVDKNAKGPAPRQNKPGKKEETASDRLKFAPMPGSFVQKVPNVTRSEKFLTVRNEKNIFPETAKRSLCNPGIRPCLIREIFLSPPSPTSVNTLIESAIVFQNNGNFSMALTTLDKAKSTWLEVDRVENLRTEFDLFFEMTRGAIYESCEKDSLALGQYAQTKLISDKLPFTHPDRALVYCGLGSVLHHMENSDVALRCYLMAKKIRERTIGGNTVDTATVYNNIGVCFNKMTRFQEAYVYMELAEAILNSILGPHHTRTLTVRQNIERLKRESMLSTPEYDTLWSKEIADPFPKEKKRGKKKGKKKGKKN